MRTFIVILVCLFVGVSCQNKPQYTIDGKISGNADGMKVLLNKLGDTGSTLVDSTFIKDGKFVFEGVVDEPAYYSIMIESYSSRGSFFREVYDKYVNSIWKILRSVLVEILIVYLLISGARSRGNKPRSPDRARKTFIRSIWR